MGHAGGKARSHSALLGWIGPIQAAMIHLGPDILIFINSIKLLRVRLAA